MAFVSKCLESSAVGYLHIKWKFQLVDISTDISLIFVLLLANSYRPYFKSTYDSPIDVTINPTRIPTFSEQQTPF